MVGADRGGQRRTRGKRRDRAVERAFSLETIETGVHYRFRRRKRIEADLRRYYRDDKKKSGGYAITMACTGRCCRRHDERFGLS